MRTLLGDFLEREDPSEPGLTPESSGVGVGGSVPAQPPQGGLVSQQMLMGVCEGHGAIAEAEKWAWAVQGPCWGLALMLLT